MATNKHIIDIQTRGAAKSKKQIQGITGTLSKMAVRAGAAAAAFYAAKGLIQGMSDLARQAAAVEQVRRGFDNLGKGIGFTETTFRKLDKAVNSTMKQVDLMTKANNAMFLGIVKSDDEMAQLFDTAQRLGQALGLDTAQAIDSIVTGMGRQSKLMLDNLGIMIDTNKAYEDYARSLGVSSSELSEQERKIAFNNAVLAESQRLVEGLGEEVEDTAMIFAQMDTSIDDAKIALGDLFTPVVTLGAKAITGMANALEDAIYWSEAFAREQEYGVKIIDDAAKSFQEWEKSMESATEQRILSQFIDLGIASEDMSLAQIKAFAATFDLNKVLSEEADNLQILTEEQVMLSDVEETRNAKLEKLLELLKIKENLTKEELSNQAIFNDNQDAAVAKREKELEYLDDWIDKNKEKAKVLGLVNSVQAKREALFKEDVANLQMVAQEIKEFQGVAKAAAIAQTTYDTYQSASTLFYRYADAYPPPTGEILGGISAALAVTAGLARVQQIKKAQYGADFIADSPQLLMVGEGSAGSRERVQVTPLDDPNLEGPVGQGITVNIQGSVIGTEEFTENTLIPQIREGLRLGEQI
jgi:hypothetical protein